jgi:hypothetical protein
MYAKEMVGCRRNIGLQILEFTCGIHSLSRELIRVSRHLYVFRNHNNLSLKKENHNKVKHNSNPVSTMPPWTSHSKLYDSDPVSMEDNK